MKNFVKVFTMLALALLVVGGMSSCKKKEGCTDATANNYDKDAKKDDGSCTYDPTESTTELMVKKTTTAPTIDGTVDNVWNDAPVLKGTTTVPDPGQDLFKGYVGNTNDFTLKGLYDDTYIYFLAEWKDVKESRDRQTWYFDPGTKRWAQEDRNPTFDANGNETRRAFYEDKWAFLFNVNNSVPNWNTLTCYATCHTGLSEADGKARHYTSLPGQTIDMWHWKYARTNINTQSDDQFQNDTYPNGRHGDDKTGGGYKNNVQELVVSGTNDTVKVPKYFIPNRTDYSWITVDEINSNTAQLITAVDQDGKLTYSGGTIDPVTDTDFQRNGPDAGAKGMPSIYTEAFQGSRGDIISKGIYANGKWTLEMKRKLNTGDPNGQDIDFSSLNDLRFGIGIFDNAGLAHGIAPNYDMKFQK
jgi:Ethylbenzene dehydrogenase